MNELVVGSTKVWYKAVDEEGTYWGFIRADFKVLFASHKEIIDIALEDGTWWWSPEGFTYPIGRREAHDKFAELLSKVMREANNGQR